MVAVCFSNLSLRSVRCRCFVRLYLAPIIRKFERI
jgi:hypothetical protein